MMKYINLLSMQKLCKMMGLALTLLAALACGSSNVKDKRQSTSKSTPKSAPTQKAQAKVLRPAQLSTKYNWIIPTNQSAGDVLPPQPGTLVQGVPVKGGKNSDTNWTAFTLVLYIDSNDSIEILTQKRAIRPTGTIETTGGHLTGGQTWRVGALTEVQQESGVKLAAADLIFLMGAQPQVNRQGRLFGNANFFVAFTGQKPATTDSCREIDQKYGHKWLDLKNLYADVSQENRALGFGHGVYYGNFRNHVIAFCHDVLGWP